ncbi:hypothetical protein [Erwinia tracheiphila]|uniref:hypothetical protein n=1 Tax=Erwinia tracheiphila TaxID=65700 RepID=UPI00398B330C
MPGVGRNLQDHLEVYMQFRCKKPVSLYPSLQWWNQLAIGAEWLFRGSTPQTWIFPQPVTAGVVT